LEDEWPKKLERVVLEIYNLEGTTNEKLVEYYKLGQLLNDQPFQYRTKLSEIKRKVEGVIGKRLYEKPYNITLKLFDIYSNEEEALENRFDLTPSKIFHLKRNEIMKILT
jgi:hypothetical protein